MVVPSAATNFRGLLFAAPGIYHKTFSPSQRPIVLVFLAQIGVREFQQQHPRLGVKYEKRVWVCRVRARASLLRRLQRNDACIDGWAQCIRWGGWTEPSWAAVAFRTIIALRPWARWRMAAAPSAMLCPVLNHRDSSAAIVYARSYCRTRIKTPLYII